MLPSTPAVTTRAARLVGGCDTDDVIRRGVPSDSARLPPMGQGVPVRVGRYATYGAQHFSAAFTVQGTAVVLLTREDPPTPRDLPWTAHSRAGWRVEVRRADVSRLFEVVTWALYDDVHPVNVLELHEDGTAFVAYLQGPDYPANAYASVATPRREDGSFSPPEGFRPMYEPGTPLVAVVPVEALSHVVEQERETPLSPEDALDAVWGQRAHRRPKGRKPGNGR